MDRVRARTVAALVAGAAFFSIVVATSDGSSGRRAPQTAAQGAAGSPARGRLLYLSSGCAGCHEPAPDGSQPSVGPQLTLDLLTADAARAGEPLGPFVVESMVKPDAFASPGYSGGVMPSYSRFSRQQLDDVVSYLIGKPYTSPLPLPAPIPRNPVAACGARKTCKATVARWSKLERLPAAAQPGAKIVAVSGCLSCHRYAGAGKRRAGAPDLSAEGRKRLTTAQIVKQLSCPSCTRAGALMPSYAGLGSVNLRRVARFLNASGGVRR